MCDHSRGASMKFGKDLAVNTLEKWTQQYIDYKALKTILKKGPSDATKVDQSCTVFSTRFSTHTQQPMQGRVFRQIRGRD